MSPQVGITDGDFGKVFPGFRSACESLVLASRPSDEIEVDASEKLAQSGFVEASIIIDPA